MTDTKKKVVTINVRKAKSTGQKGELLDSINHERLHTLHPKANDGKKFEEKVKRSTAHLSKESKAKLHNLINGKRKSSPHRRRVAKRKQQRKGGYGKVKSANKATQKRWKETQ